MKFKALLYFLVISNIVVFGCAQQPKDPMENMEKGKMNVHEDLEFKKMCQDAGYEWMKMKPTQDGKFIKDSENCWGCMVEGIEHVCDKEKYMELVKTDMEEEGMHTMEPTAMTAHGGNSNSVNIHNYKVGFTPSDIEVGKESMLKFAISEIHSGKPISNLEIVHDKIMHVVLVRDDLKHFDHIHPEVLESGVFAVPYRFSSSGIYRIWVDFTIDGMQHIIDFYMNVSGNIDIEEKEMLDGIKVNFNPPKEIVAEKKAELKFEIFDSNNKPIPITEKFLGATAHLIEIDETLEEFRHNHDESFDNDNLILFEHKFEKQGRHKLWIQFSIDNKTKTASFEVTVK